MSGTPTEIEVFVDDADTSGQVLRAGTAWLTSSRGTTSATFTYDRAFQRGEGPGQRSTWDVSPDLPRAAGRAHTAGLPGAFADSAPDRWGRTLVTKGIRAQARADGRTAPTLTDADFLLGVSDETRQGALRYTRPGDRRFLAPDAEVPELLELPALLAAADEVARDAESSDALKVLLDAGSGSLGGARPKASVRDGSRLYIAKFPHPGDGWDVMAWAKTVLDLAEAAGIPVPARRLQPVGRRQVLLVERFDRADGGRRVGYVSGMTLVGGRDGETRDYLELAESVAEQGDRVAGDLVGLWRRVAFFLAVNNVDDHLRNHGFLRGPAGWRLAPVFDVNPDPDLRAERATSIGWVAGRRAAAAALMEAAPSFGVSQTQAREILGQVLAAVSGWRAAADANGVRAPEVGLFAAAFDEAPLLWP